MSELVRFGVSLDAALLGSFDDLCARRGYASRSEALRDMIRQELLKEHSRHDDHPATGVFSMVYDHHQPELSQQLTSRQHDAHSCIVATLHVHLDHNNCLEILVLRGMAGEISRLAERLRAVRGVKYGSFTFTSGDVLP
jgi:CopG family nickel-responsive transcriptional regulator